MKENTTYFITLKARDVAGNVSKDSQTIKVKRLDGTAPIPPTGLVTSNRRMDSFTVKWNLSTDNGQCFKRQSNDNCNYLDAQLPSTPSNLSITSITGSSLALNWTASTDNVAVNGYEIYRNGNLIGTSMTTSYQVTGINEKKEQTFTVRATNAAGYKSAECPDKEPAYHQTHQQTSKYEFQTAEPRCRDCTTALKGQTVVPHKPILEAMGLTVKYDSKTKTVTAIKQESTIRLTEGKTVANANGSQQDAAGCSNSRKGNIDDSAMFCGRGGGLSG